LFGDRDAAQRVLTAETPLNSRRSPDRSSFRRSVWDLFREGVVFAGNYARFSQNRQRELLFATRGTMLVEASHTTAVGASVWRG